MVRNMKLGFNRNMNRSELKPSVHYNKQGRLAFVNTHDLRNIGTKNAKYKEGNEAKTSSDSLRFSSLSNLIQRKGLLEGSEKLNNTYLRCCAAPS